MGILKRTAFLCLVLTLPVIAGSGDLDSSFGDSPGRVTTALGGMSADHTRDVALQSDGKLVAVGYRDDNTRRDTFIARYQVNGILDPTFNLTGTIILRASEGYNQAHAVAIQPDGKILVAGFGGTTSPDFMMLRFNNNGTVDPSFGVGGFVFTDFGNNSLEEIEAIAIQPDGKIVAAGRTRPSSGWYEIAVARYNPNGSLDSDFGNNGVVINPFGVGDDDSQAVAIRSDGKIVVFGNRSNTVTNAMIALRYDSTGALDPSFDTDGILVFEQPVEGLAFAIQPDGKMIAAGSTRTPGNSSFALLRITQDGSMDPSFGTNGMVTTSVTPIDDIVGDIVVYPDGKILLGGGSSSSFSLVRYNGDGSLDGTFGSSGVVYTSIGTTSNMITGLVLQPDYKVVAAGYGVRPSSFVDIALARYDLNGDLDKDFGFVALTSTPVGVNFDEASSVALQSDGKIVSGGKSGGDNGRFDCAFTRHNPDGSVDSSFGITGKVRLSLNDSDDGVVAIAIQPDGKIVAVGFSGTAPNSRMAVLRLNTDGTLDTGFSNGGVLTMPVQGSGYSVLIQPDGKIVSGGYVVVGPRVSFVLNRLNADGSFDTSFDEDGTATIDLNGRNGIGRDAVLQPDGKIVITGSVLGPGSPDFATARFHSNGTPDIGFGTNGYVITRFSDQEDEAHSVALGPGGTIIVAGSSASTSSHDFAVARYRYDGSLDPTFDGDGKTLTPVQTDAVDEATGLIVQRDGKIILGGISEVFSSSNINIALVRYNVDGLLDNSFGVGGKVITDYGKAAEVLSAMTMRPDGKIIVTGGISKGAGREFALIRYLNDVKSPFDYDGDGRSDISIYRPVTGDWYVQRSTAGFFGQNFGSSEDRIAPADYDGDGKTDIAVYRPSTGIWYVTNSSNGAVTYNVFGIAEDLPTPADYDGDGKADISVFRPSTGTWYRQNSSNGAFVAAQFGATGDKPTVGDFDGDGKADIAVFRPSTGAWYQTYSSNGTFFGEQFGISTDKVTPADYDGDGKTDIAIYRPSEGLWYVKRSATNTYVPYVFGLAADIPTPGDFDGDGKADIGVFRPSDGTWYIVNSSNGSYTIQQFGQSGDVPTLSAFSN